MNYLSKTDLLDLHAFAVERYGGLLGVKSQDLLQTAVVAPRQELFGEELYPDLPGKAAALVYMLVKSHPFVAANEATGLLALLRFLELNDAALRPEIDASELAWMFRALGSSDLDRNGLEEWLRAHVEARP